MNKVGSGVFYVGRAENGKFVAASVDAVKFCFVCDTEQEAVDKACRAYNFATGTEPRREIEARSRTTEPND